MMTSHLKLYKSNDWSLITPEWPEKWPWSDSTLNIDTSIYDSDAEQNNPDWPSLVQQTTSIIHFKGCPLEAQEWSRLQYLQLTE